MKLAADRKHWCSLVAALCLIPHKKEVSMQSCYTPTHDNILFLFNIITTINCYYSSMVLYNLLYCK